MKLHLKPIFTTFLAVALTLPVALSLSACGEEEKPDPTPPAPEVKNYTLEDKNLTSNDKKLYTQIGIPADTTGKLPVVIMCNGANQLYTSTDVFAEYFLKNKICATIQFDYTNTGYNKTKSEGDAIDLSIASMQNNIKTIYDYAVTDERFDAEHISILGYSLGGLNASIYASQHADDIHTLFTLAPAYDMYYFARGLNVEINADLTDVTITDMEDGPMWGDPYADDAPVSVPYNGMTMSNAYIKECWNLDYSKFFDENGFQKSTLMIVGDEDSLLAHCTAVRNLYKQEDGTFSFNEFMNWHIVPGADHMMAAKMPDTVCKYLGDFVKANPL